MGLKKETTGREGTTMSSSVCIFWPSGGYVSAVCYCQLVASKSAIIS